MFLQGLHHTATEVPMLSMPEDKNDIEAAEKTLRDTADSKLKEEKEKEPEEMEKKTAKKKTTLTTMPSPKQDIFSDPLRAAEESDLLKAVGTTDPFGAEEALSGSAFAICSTGS